MDGTTLGELEKALSLERFSRYLAWAGGDRHQALALYTLNCQLSESLYIPLHALEIALRNRIHTVASAAVGSQANWYDLPMFQRNSRQVEQLDKAKADLAANHKPLEPGRVVAALTFGYWTAFFGKDYEQLWRQTLKAIARRPDGRQLSRKDFATPLAKLRPLRNRMAHHEPILDWNLPQHYATIVEMTGWLSPAAAHWLQECSRFTATYPVQGITLVKGTAAHS